MNRGRIYFNIDSDNYHFAFRYTEIHRYVKNPYNLFQNSGIGSPGTISEAIVGYTGSNEYKRGRNWVISSILEGQ